MTSKHRTMILALGAVLGHKVQTELRPALQLERGVSGYINHTVPVALYCWLRWPSDFRHAVEDAIVVGGDTDTTAAIVGGLAGATLGVRAIPESWIGGLCEWPRSVTWITRLAQTVNQFSGSDAASSSDRPRGSASAWPAGVVHHSA